MSSKRNKPRELRRRVVVPARLRHGSSWTDACILNVSSRGLMIHTGREIAPGAEVELRRGDNFVIIARVMWREGGRAGLKAEDGVPVGEILTLGRSPALQPAAAGGERRSRRRSGGDSRMRARALEFAGVLVIGLSLAIAGVSMVEKALAWPLALVSLALGG